MLEVHSTSSLFLTDSIEITPTVVFNKHMALQNNKSPGPVGWPISIIKFVSELMCHYFI